MRAALVSLLLLADGGTPMKPSDFKLWVGKQVTLEGKAEDAKAGAVLLVEGEPLYLRGVSAWPAALRGKPVSVSGKLAREKLIPSPVKDAKGAISQGAEGEQWVLEQPTWK